MKRKDEKEIADELMRWADYLSSDESTSDKEMAEPHDDIGNNERRHDEKKHNTKTDENENNNPWKIDKRNNKIRFAEKSQRGYWAKVKFEISGYHKDQDKNGNKKLYNFELGSVHDILTAILRKGKLMDPSFAILPIGENDNRKIDKESNISIMVKEMNKSLWSEGEIKRYIYIYIYTILLLTTVEIVPCNPDLEWSTGILC